MAWPGRDRSLIIEAGGSGFVYDLSTGVEVLAVDGDWMMPDNGHWELLDGGKLLLSIKVKDTDCLWPWTLSGPT